MFHTIYQWAQANPVAFAATISTAQYFWGVFVQSLKAPTATSGQFYVSLFALANASASNWKRASIPKVEDSPNWQAAVEKHVEAQGQGGSTQAPKQP